MKKCYIIGASDMTEQISPSCGDLVIAADGGAEHLRRLGLAPDIMIGDFDSLKSGVAFPTAQMLKFPKEKNETDTHLAFLEGQRRGYDKFLIYGGTGGRADHTFANYAILLYAKEAGAEAYLIGGGGYWFALTDGECEINCKKGADVSVFAFGGEAEGVSIKGLLYEVENVSLTPSFPLGVSNSSLGKKAQISVDSGSLLIYVADKFEE